MSIHTFDLAIILGYAVIIVLSGIAFSRLAAHNIDSYFLGGRRIPWYLLGISNASGMFDITGTMWAVSLLFVYGLKSVWMPWLWPVWNQIFMMVYLAVWMRRSGVVTGAEWLSTRFAPGLGLNLSHISTVLFAIITVIAMIAYAFEGIGKFAVVFLPWDFSPQTYAIIVLGLTTIYVTLGGMYSVVLTDIVQFLLMTIVSIWVGCLALQLTSAESIAAAVPDGWGELFFGWRMNLDWSGHIAAVQAHLEADLLYEMIGAFVMLCILKGILASAAGPTPGYDMQRVLATETPRDAALMSGLVTPILALPRYFLIAGVTVLALVNFNDELLQEQETNAVKVILDDSQAGAATAAPEKVDFEQVLPFVIREFLPVGLVGLVLAGLLAAFMSTFDSTVNAGAAYLVNDIYKRYLKPHASGRQQVVASYLCSLGVVIVGIVVGVKIASINDVLKWVTAGLYGGYVAPNFLKWYWWRLNGVGYFAGMVTGTGLALVQAAVQHPLIPTEPLYAFPFILMISGTATIIASFLTAPEDDETLVSFYRTVRPWGFWGPVREECIASDPSFVPNPDFYRDAFNCFVGTVWQTALVVLPIYFVIRNYRAAIIAGVVALVGTVILKFNWYDNLQKEPAVTAAKAN